MNNRQCYFIYPKDKNGKLTGHCICVMVHDEKVFHGSALCSESDNFNKTVGRGLALERAKQSIERYEARKSKDSENLLAKLVTYFKGN